MRHIRPGVALMVTLHVASGAARAQVSPFELTKLADGVHAAIFTPLPGANVDGTAVIVINDADVLVVDTQNSPSAARAVIAAIRTLTDKPVRYVVNTHWHGDHHFGNQVYQEVFPGIEFIGHPATREDIPGRMGTQLDTVRSSLLPRMIRNFDSLHAAGMTGDGKPMTAEQRSASAQRLGVLGWMLDEMKATRIVTSTLTVERRMVLHRGERTIDIRFLGRGNTRGDLVVFLPRERIVATGDLLVHPVPFAFGSDLGEWIETLRAIRALPADIIIPGHGAPQRSREYIDSVIELLASTLSQARAAVAKGLDLEGTRKAVDLEAFRARFAGTDANRNRQFANYFVVPGVERAFLEAKGRIDRD
jgi:glyoxylase-like metal-dependent hydrolase (beta-lactamase superfamily II)